MKRFKEFLAEAFLIEGKIDDLKAQNPSLHNEIDQYATADTSATKKFLPWLVAQHKKGNVTPDHPNLHQTIQNFDRYKNLHGIKDHSNRSFQEVRDAVVPLIGKGATKAEIAHEGREKIHDSGDIQAYHIKTKEASQRFYGGGPEAGPTNTTWCVSARSKDCLYGRYGEMYTIHSKGDPNSPYAIHPEQNKITNRHNDGDRDIDQEIDAKPEIAKLKPAIDSIQTHIDPVAHRLKTADDLSDDEINAALNGTSFHKEVLMKNNSYKVGMATLNALNHPNANAEITHLGAKHVNPYVATIAINHPKADYRTTMNAAAHHSYDVAMTALKHPKANNWTTWAAVKNPNPQIAIAALNHWAADYETKRLGINHPDPNVRQVAKTNRF